ncbi:hypothetical protein [Haloechinothrix sp. LS1_15]|uniref:hypothetical protein n=1 Tax=Haloechinothrix sp. LS1_15 TaxID=2652248 RepID=UPI0029442AC9|nr:hypothetical protein [Haloechinothrix sp. LS1_15]MDV6011370.1 hypothetical protein [Haloechinothrix sp. LS1_15]
MRPRSNTVDGTQAPSPEPMYPDPLAGLITGESTRASVPGTDSDSFDAPARRRIESDPDRVADFIKAALEDDPAGQGDGGAGATGSRQDSGDSDSAGDGNAHRLMAGATSQARRVFTDGQAKTSAGVAVAVIMLLLFVIIAVSLLATVAGMVSP